MGADLPRIIGVCNRPSVTKMDWSFRSETIGPPVCCQLRMQCDLAGRMAPSTVDGLSCTHAGAFGKLNLGIHTVGEQPYGNREQVDLVR